MFTYEQISSFNELEMSVYNYIIRNKEQVAYMKIRELADGAHVSTTTILRFCNKVGCEGYTEFKLKLKQYLKSNQQKQPDLDIDTIMEYFRRAKTEPYQAAVDKAVDILTQSTLIIFIGIGTSGILGKYGARYFNNAGWLSLWLDDPFTPIFKGENRTIAVIALSVSGVTEQTIHLANQLKKRGCALISITNTANCPLAQISDCNISYYTPQLRVDDSIDFTSQIPVMFILESMGRRLRGRTAGETP